MDKRITQTKQVPLGDLTSYPENPRRGDVAAIRESLETTGQYRALVVRADTREVLAGNHTLAAMAELGYEKALCHLVEVDDEQARRIVLADNRTAELASYDEEALARLLAEMDDLQGTGWDQAALDELNASVNGNKAGTDTDPGEPPAKPKTKPGDLYVLGEHRLLCGDATVDSDVSRLMDGPVRYGFHDPPYGIDVIGGSKAFGSIGGSNIVRAGRYEPIVGDNEPFDPRQTLALCAEAILWGANHYADKLPPSRGWLVWDKKGRDWDDNFSDCEMAWTSFDRPASIYRHVWMGMVQEGAREPRVHPTQKPVALLEAIMRDLFRDTGTVLDLFAGSGPTLIACENLGRRCYAMEIDPGYVDVIVDRWERHTGQKATRERR